MRDRFSRIVKDAIDLLQYGGRSITIKRSLLRTIIGLLFAFALTLFAISYWVNAASVADLSEKLISASIREVNGDVEIYFHRVEQQLLMSKRLLQARVLRSGDASAWNNYFAGVPVIKEKHVTSVHVLSDADSEYMLLNAEKFRMNRISAANADPVFIYFDERWQRIQKPVELTEDREYRPYKRDWYLQAMQQKPDEAIRYTAAYRFRATQEPGITATTVWNEGATKKVVAFDLRLKELSAFATRIKPTPHSQAMIFDEQARILGISDDLAENLPVSVLKTPDELGLFGVGAAIRAWRVGGVSDQIFSLNHGGQKYWGGLRREKSDSIRGLTLLVMIPEDDFNGSVRKLQLMGLLVLVLVLIASLFAVLSLARSYSAPLERLARESSGLANLSFAAPHDAESRIYEIRELEAAQKKAVAALQSFSRYIPIEVVRSLVREGAVAAISGEQKNISILFTDIADFTTTSEQMQPDELSRHMAEYFETIIEILHAEYATVDKFIGDAIMAFWGAPLALPNHAQHALRAVMRCKADLNRKAVEWQARGLPGLYTRFGLDSGDAIVGNFGAPSRLSYTVLGDRVNQASRLESLNKLYGTQVLVSQRIAEANRDAFSFRTVDRVAVKGKTEAVTLYEPIGLTAALTQEQLELIQRYEEAFSQYQSGDMQNAGKKLSALGKADFKIDYLIARIREFTASPPGSNWDGVHRLNYK